MLGLKSHLKIIIHCEVTTEPPVGGELVNTIKNNKYMSNYQKC